MSAIALLMGLLVLSYVGSFLVGSGKTRGLASGIEFIALGEVLQARYGERIDFPAWIATMDVDEIIGMCVGQLVDHIVESLSAAAGGEPHGG